MRDTRTELCRYGEKMGKMVRGSEATYEELFSYACPKFVTCAPPNLDAPSSNTNQARSPSVLKRGAMATATSGHPSARPAYWIRLQVCEQHSRACCETPFGSAGAGWGH